MPDFSAEEFLTVDEVAGSLQITPQTVRNWLDQGRIPSLRIGRRVRILRSDFQRFVDSSYSTGTRKASDADTTA
jgi:excisionase family DNA binding protein